MPLLETFLPGWFGLPVAVPADAARLAPVAPPKVATDTVTPLPFWDTAVKNQRSITIITLRFDDILDVDRLRGALTRLL